MNFTAQAQMFFYYVRSCRYLMQHLHSVCYSSNGKHINAVYIFNGPFRRFNSLLLCFAVLMGLLHEKQLVNVFGVYVVTTRPV